MHDDEQAKKASAETDVTAAQATPTAQIVAPAPLAAATPPPVVPVVNGVPEERRP